jgi:glycosyltransferase involved in cell wall biosynthesis
VVTAEPPEATSAASPEPAAGEAEAPRQRRAVVLVGNPAAPYSRALRIARTLTGLGFAVEIAAVAAPGVPDEDREDAITIRRYRPSGPLAALAVKPAPTGSSGRGRGPRSLPLRVATAIPRWLLWPHTVRGWWATLARELPPADLYHACGSLTLAAALAARRRDRRAGRQSYVIYDAIDDVAHSNNVLSVPEAVRRLIAYRERRWARWADERITVNEDLAMALAEEWDTKVPTIVPNWPDIPDSVAGSPDDRIRQALDLPTTTRIVLFHGRLGPNLGLDEAAAAVLQVPNAVLVVMGFGRGFAASVARDADPRYQGRHRTLAAVHPDELLGWTASADVEIVPLPPVSANQRASTPNKFWEALAAGTPVVIGPGLPAMGHLVETYDLGVVASSLAPADLAAAIRSVLDVPSEAAAERRARIALTAREHFRWPIAAARYREVVRRLFPAREASPSPAERVTARDLAEAGPRELLRLGRLGARFVRERRRLSALARERVANRARRIVARRTGRVVRVLFYSPANLNVIDGSAIWVEAVAATLVAGPDVWLTIPLRATERRTLITDALRRLPRVEVLPLETFRRTARFPLEIERALDWIEQLDADEPFDLLLLRGFELCRAAIGRPRLRDRIWSAYILEPERDTESPSHLADLGRIARHSARVVSQSEQMQAATEELVPDARGRIILLPPAIPSSVPRADPARVVRRLLYTGKFHPFYPVPDLIDIFDRVRADHPDLTFHLGGDKIWRTQDDTVYADALESRVKVPGVVWHGGMSRASVANLLASGGIALSIWDYRYGSHWNDLVVSTKLLDYCAAGLPVILNRTEAQQSILGADYPLFVDSIDEVEALVRRLLEDEVLYRTAAERCWTSTRAFTYEAVHERLAPYLDAVKPGELGAEEPGRAGAGP